MDIINDILKSFKVLNQIKLGDTSNDELYIMYIEKCVKDICILTNRNEFPIDLKFEVVDMLTDFYKVSILANKSEEGKQGTDFIKSISEDGRSVSFNNSNEMELNSIISANISNNLDLRLKKIYRYRLLYKVTCKDDKKD